VDFLFEFVFQVLFEIVGEFLVEVGFHAAATVLRSRIGRLAVSAAFGLLAGVWWGDHLSSVGHRPRLLWVSIAFAAAAALGGFYRQRRPVLEMGARSLVVPWLWPAYRLWGFVVLNAALATGIATGWTPPVVG
jgi:hypothetical protein